METLSWSQAEEYFGTGESWMLLIGGQKGIQVGFDAVAGYYFVRLPAKRGETPPANPLTEVSVESVQADSMPYLQVSTSTRPLFRQFHEFATILAEDFEHSGGPPGDSFQRAVAKWRALLADRSPLSTAEQIGLLGELLVLEGLIARYGDPALPMWVGRDLARPLRHDFRLSGGDVEVKATRTSRREHRIHGLDQLEPLPGRDLWLLSIMLEPAGGAGGRSLAELVRDIEKQLTSEKAREDFASRIRTAGYRADDVVSYLGPMLMKSPPVIAKVEDGFPHLTKPIIQAELGKAAASRIRAVEYQIDIEGIGFVQGSPQYAEALDGMEI